MLVSILVPTRNRPLTLRRCLTGLCNQQFGDFEVCIVNDGGDSVRSVVEPFRHRLTVRLLELERSHGQVVARKKALALSSGELISFCDDDDEFLPDHLAELTNHIVTCDLVYSDVVISATGGAAGFEELRFAFEYSPALLRRTNFIVPSAVLYKKALHRVLGDWDEDAGQYWDWDWFLRVSTVARVARSRKRTLRYYFDVDGANVSAKPDQHRSALEYLSHKHRLGSLPSANFYLMAKHGLKKLGII